MTYTVRWIRSNRPSEEGSQSFVSREEALETARAVRGTALVVENPAGSVIVLKDGHTVEGAEAINAVLEFRSAAGNLDDPITRDQRGGQHPKGGAV